MKRSLRDAIYGLAVGDALGLPVQFKTRDKYSYLASMIEGLDPRGTFSDDTSMTLAICDSLKRNHLVVDEKDIRKCFERWFFDGAYTQDGKAIDVGGTCARAIELGHGLDGEHNQGNGSLMRTIPLAFLPDVSEEEIRKVSAITHGHPTCMEACVCYVRIAQDILAGMKLKEAILNNIPEGSLFEEVRWIEEYERELILSTGYVVNTFEAAMWCLLTTDSYRECMVRAINLGDDTDTVAAVAGGIAGILYGYEDIPKEWIEAIRKKEIIEEYLF